MYSFKLTSAPSTRAELMVGIRTERKRLAPRPETSLEKYRNQLALIRRLSHLSLTWELLIHSMSELKTSQLHMHHGGMKACHLLRQAWMTSCS
ncbi:hypothetical protein V5799_017159 [Amblyomma americanum]|uniref:Uncharacterized protein n=1 Tax=Amblyomma americanum TaxID=6943 RepID=A0AAQ4F439_AMBAM